MHQNDRLPIHADLHSHSICSDGTLAPEALVDAAADAGIRVFALTDHDSTEGIERARARCAARGIEWVAGVEISTEFGEQSAHLLGLWLSDWNHPGLQAIFARSKDERRARVHRQVEVLKELGYELTPEEVFARAGGETVAKPHVAQVLIDKGYFRDRDEVFDKLLGDGKPGYVGRAKLTIAEAIGAVHAAGGKAVLAHPGLEGFDDAAIGAMRSIGLDGLEVHHPDHSPDQRRRFTGLAETLGLIVTGGSDFHLTPRDALGKNGLDAGRFAALSGRR